MSGHWLGSFLVASTITTVLACVMVWLIDRFFACVNRRIDAWYERKMAEIRSRSRG